MTGYVVQCQLAIIRRYYCINTTITLMINKVQYHNKMKKLSVSRTLGKIILLACYVCTKSTVVISPITTNIAIDLKYKSSGNFFWLISPTDCKDCTINLFITVLLTKSYQKCSWS